MWTAAFAAKANSLFLSIKIIALLLSGNKHSALVFRTARPYDFPFEILNECYQNVNIFYIHLSVYQRVKTFSYKKAHINMISHYLCLWGQACRIWDFSGKQTNDDNEIKSIFLFDFIINDIFVQLFICSNDIKRQTRLYLYLFMNGQRTTMPFLLCAVLASSLERVGEVNSI